jgi:hypothetical protein
MRLIVVLSCSNTLKLVTAATTAALRTQPLDDGMCEMSRLISDMFSLCLL